MKDNNDVNVANTIIFELQDRIDKAIEYIEEHKNIMGFYEEVNGDDLMKILKGEGK